MKRYTITADFYIWAENDEEAKAKAYQWQKNMNDLHDNQASVLSLHETPFAQLVARKVKFK